MVWIAGIIVENSISISSDQDKPLKNRIPVRDGLFIHDSSGNEKPQLIIGKCLNCGALRFPARQSCQNCQSKEIRKIPIEGAGKLYSFTSVPKRPPGFFYRGDVPYLLAYVELPIGLRIRTLLTACNLEDLEIGMAMALVIEKLHDDEAGNVIVTYKFKPAR